MREIDPRIRAFQKSPTNIALSIFLMSVVFILLWFTDYRATDVIAAKLLLYNVLTFGLIYRRYGFSHGERRLAAEFIVLIWLISRLL